MNFKNVIMLSLGMTLFFVVTSMIKRKFTDKKPQEMALHEQKDNRPQSRDTKTSGRTPSSYSVDNRKADQRTKFSSKSIDRDANNLIANKMGANHEESSLGFDDEETDESYDSQRNIRDRKVSNTIDAFKKLTERNNNSNNNSNPSQGDAGDIHISGVGYGNVPAETNDDKTETPSREVSETSLTCSTDVGSGSYSNPVNVSVTCSTSSDITYCVGPAGVCCDPLVGSVYSGPIPIGATNGNYCLRFSATAVNGKTASGQKDYLITVTLPELTVTTAKIQYQTT